MRKFFRFLSVTVVLSGLALAQDAGVPKVPSPDRERQMSVERERTAKKRMMDDRERVELRMGPGGDRAPFPQGKFWKNTELAQRLGLSDSQVVQMEKIFQDTRLRLIDLHANLQKQEAILEPLIDTDTPEEAKVLQQIEKVTAARGDLEKANAQMLLGIRRVMTADQWKKLKAGQEPGMYKFRVPGPGPEGEGPPPPRRPGDDDLL
ncbi:MAG: hypothetical protein JWO13_3113 [Acidobacteriales bacterium]|nr:hypothetical protein [Terriglobales bacterium]